MAKLTTKQRKNLSSGSFAIPSKAPGPGSYPINDPSHARNALSRVAQHGSSAEQSQVKSAVHRKFPGIGRDKNEGSPAEERGESPAKERREVASGMEKAMGAQADKMHPVKRK